MTFCCSRGARAHACRTRFSLVPTPPIKFWLTAATKHYQCKTWTLFCCSGVPIRTNEDGTPCAAFPKNVDRRQFFFTSNPAAPPKSFYLQQQKKSPKTLNAVFKRAFLHRSRSLRKTCFSDRTISTLLFRTIRLVRWFINSLGLIKVMWSSDEKLIGWLNLLLLFSSVTIYSSILCVFKILI